VRLIIFVSLFAFFGCQQDFRQPDAGHPISASLLACAANSSPPVTSISGAIDRLNSLPRPVGGPCFVASLQRPISMVATVGTVSAQPAAGEHDPRVFLLADGVVIAVVPKGAGGDFIELGQWVSPTRTLKAEIALPVTEPRPADEPFTRLESQKADAGVTVCGMCHHSEELQAPTSHGYISAAYRPLAADERSLQVLATEHQECITNGEESPRCDMFHALFDFGELRQGAFETVVERFGQ